MPRPAASWRTTDPHARLSTPGCSSIGISSSGLPNPITSNMTVGAVVGGVVDDLHAADLLDALAGSGQRQRKQVVGETGVDAVDEEARITFPCSIFDRFEQLFGKHLPRVLQEDRRCCRRR